jgi:hypothetical protein
MTESTDVAIVGAGPYGLSLAAHLRARGMRYRIFGPPMKFWHDMPAGVNLKSLAFATNVSVPERGHSFPEWCRAHDLEDFEPCTMHAFAAYGSAMQRRFVPDVEDVLVTNISRAPNGFEITLASGGRVTANRVVVSTGLSYLAVTPQVLHSLPRKLARHTSVISDYSEFRGKAVAVIGGGASAIEAGALVREAGGTAEVFVRGPKAIFHGRSARVRPLWERIKEPMTVFGAGRRHWLLQHFPQLVHMLPKARRIRLALKYLGPASPWWIKDRVLGKVPIHVSSELVEARATGDRVLIRIRDASNVLREAEVDCVIAGTGYSWDIDLLPFLERDLQQSIRRTAGAPALDLNFESSAKRLYFIGPLSIMSFGPLVRFVAGTDFTVRNLARHLASPRPQAGASVVNRLLGFLDGLRQTSPR